MRAGIRNLELTSNPRNVSRIEGYVQKIIEEYRVSPHQYGNILISLTEAVNNAIIHGNHNDESKKVCIHVEKTSANKLAFKVSDQGHGFNFNNVPDPTCNENIEKCGGRGVFLMRQLSDRMRYKDNGSTVEMQFRIR